MLILILPEDFQTVTVEWSGVKSGRQWEIPSPGSDDAVRDTRIRSSTAKWLGNIIDPTVLFFVLGIQGFFFPKSRLRL